MTRRWERIEQSGDNLFLWPMTFDRDAVRDVAQHLNDTFGQVTLERGPIRDQLNESGEEVPLDSLDQLADWELSRLSLKARSEAGSYVSVSFNSTHRPVVSSTPHGTAPQVAQAVAERLVAEGKPRFPVELLWTFPRALIVAAIAAVWVWVWISEDPSLSVTVLGTIGVAALIAVVLDQYRRWVDRNAGRWRTGHRIRPMSREAVRMQRANTHRDVKVALATLPIGVVGTLIVQALT